MDNATSESEHEGNNKSSSTTKKRHSHGRLRDVMAKVRRQSHETGPDCTCKRQCFVQVSNDGKKGLIKRMNSMISNDEINLYLSGLITVIPVERRRPRKDNGEASYRDATFAYRVRITKEGRTEELNVCKSAFTSLHGIGRGKVDDIVKCLKNSGNPPKDGRGKHTNRPHSVPEEIKIRMRNHIASLKGRESHYSLKDSSKIYLPADLNITKIFHMFIEKNPDVTLKMYETYRNIFNAEFNISFGYPRTDTCSQCDALQANKKSLEAELLVAKTDNEKLEIEKKITGLESDKQIHLMKANKWYELKRRAKRLSKVDNKREAIVVDYAKNLQVPNVTTNDVYYKRQLSVYLFNIHILSTGQSVFYLYPETVGRKGSDEVCSMLHNFFYNILDTQVEEIDVFTDSCSGQNKNNFIFKFYHHLVHKERKFKKITTYFPIRGHSYNECDKNTGLIKHKSEAELPEDWAEIIRNSRYKPSPFEVMVIEQPLIRDWTTHLNQMYRKKLGCATRPIRVFMVEEADPVCMSYRTFFTGPWRKNPMIPKKKKQTEEQPLLEVGTFTLPEQAYHGKFKTNF